MEHYGDRMTMEVRSVSDFEAMLVDLTGLSLRASAPIRSSIVQLFDTIGYPGRRASADAERDFYRRVNGKLGVNADAIASLHRQCAERRIVFNYHEKRAVADAVNGLRSDHLVEILKGRGIGLDEVHSILSVSRFATAGESRLAIQQEASSPTRLRKAADRDVSQDVFDACAGPLVWSLWSPEALRSVESSWSSSQSEGADFLDRLKGHFPEIFARDRSLVIRGVDIGRCGDYSAVLGEMNTWISHEFGRLDNYGHLAVVFDRVGANQAFAWQLVADLTLFAERFIQDPLKKLFFRSKEVEAETRAHIEEMPRDCGSFDRCVEGYTYRDLFVVHDEDQQVQRLVLLFQKNERDETRIPCPACWTMTVEGNSYPSLGVKSWECRNPICPDRSIYNRGKRYSFKALLSQAAIEQRGNEVPAESVSSWRRDVVSQISVEAISTMLVRHYSMLDDVVALIDFESLAVEGLGRKVVSTRSEGSASPLPAANFWASPFFDRFVVPTNRPSLVRNLPDFDRWEVLEGDATDVLAGLPSDVVDRAVTSPPYFNAREYSQWPNLYCYLHDMYAIHQELFRVLKPGALYFFNIFDYFDNERIITFSLMGKKRIALSALFVDLMRRAGFHPEGNLVWDKGDVQGKRSFNAGNFSPFYQSPLNCWEHVLVFRKPGLSAEQRTEPRLNRVMRLSPVIKIVRGENTYGHTAPFPFELPLALLEGIGQNEIVLDPFGGSGTTARAALAKGARAIMIEQNPEYCSLSRSLTEEFVADQVRTASTPTLF